jgi:hypothetical protein
MLAVMSCSNGQGNDYCLIAQPIRPSAADMGAISDSLVQQILTHDKTGQALCGWKSDP